MANWALLAAGRPPRLQQKAAAPKDSFVLCVAHTTLWGGGLEAQVAPNGNCWRRRTVRGKCGTLFGGTTTDSALIVFQWNWPVRADGPRKSNLRLLGWKKGEGKCPRVHHCPGGRRVHCQAHRWHRALRKQAIKLFLLRTPIQAPHRWMAMAVVAFCSALLEAKKINSLLPLVFARPSLPALLHLSPPTAETPCHWQIQFWRHCRRRQWVNGDGPMYN